MFHAGCFTCRYVIMCWKSSTFNQDGLNVKRADVDTLDFPGSIPGTKRKREKMCFRGSAISPRHFSKLYSVCIECMECMKAIACFFTFTLIELLTTKALI